jgi:hypothetical protein
MKTGNISMYRMENKLLGRITDFSFEQNYYYDAVYLKDIIVRDLKIRRKSKVSGNKKLIESRLIYKIPLGHDEYAVKNIKISSEELSEILTESLDGYRVCYVPVFASICESDKFPSLFILIKRYSKNMLTLAVMGHNKSSVDNFLKRSRKVIDVKIIPSPTDSRSVNDEFSIDFDYDLLVEEELKRFRKYYHG